VIIEKSTKKQVREEAAEEVEQRDIQAALFASTERDEYSSVSDALQECVSDSFRHRTCCRIKDVCG